MVQCVQWKMNQPSTIVYLDTTKHDSVADMPQCICLDFTRYIIFFLAMGKRGQWDSCKKLHYVYIFASICTNVFLSCQQEFFINET